MGTARKSGRCMACGRYIGVGDLVEYSRFLKSRVHPVCGASLRRLQREVDAMLKEYQEIVRETEREAEYQALVRSNQDLLDRHRARVGYDAPLEGLIAEVRGSEWWYWGDGPGEQP